MTVSGLPEWFTIQSAEAEISSQTVSLKLHSTISNDLLSKQCVVVKTVGKKVKFVVNSGQASYSKTKRRLLLQVSLITASGRTDPNNKYLGLNTYFTSN